MNGHRDPSRGVLKRLHGVLFRRTRSEASVVPAEVEVVVRGTGGPGGDTIRSGGRAPRGARAEYAYRAGYDGRGRLSFESVVTPGCSAMLVRPETLAAA